MCCWTMCDSAPEELPVVGRAELHAQEGQSENDEAGRGGHREERCPAHDEGGHAAPRRPAAGRVLPSAPEQTPQVQGVHPVAEEHQRGGEQDQGGGRGEQHDGDARVGEGAQEVLREDQHRGQRHGDREGGEENGPARGAQGDSDRGARRGAGGQLLTESADDEQGVVDGEAETERRRQVHREDRDVRDLGESAQHRVGAEDRDDPDPEREQGRDGAAEDHDQQQEGHREGDHLGPGEVLLDGRLHLVPYGDRSADLDLDGPALSR